ncbi:MAG: hypothetical protein JOY71_04505 [Acetobacteraceae bacterium]|nr:hypothetical protein [Acetobacteraceae bacterium]
MNAITANFREFDYRIGVSAMANRTGKPRLTPLSMLLDLAGFGLAAAASIVFYAIAAFSGLYISEETPKSSEIRDRDIEVRPVQPPVPVKAELLGLGAEATLSTPPRDTPAILDMRRREVSGAQPVSEPASLGASEASATQEVKLDADNAAALSHEKMPRQAIQQGHSHDYYFRTNAASWSYRLIKECGPIKNRTLYTDCVRSFRAQYRGHYVSATTTYSGRGF